MREKDPLIMEFDLPIGHNYSFKEIIDLKRKNLAYGLYSGKRKYYPLQKIAEELGMSKGMLQKRINKAKRTTNRDFVIGLCVVLCMDQCWSCHAGY